MLQGLAIRLGVVGTLVIGGVGWYYTDRNLNYVEIPARIDDVKTRCMLEVTKEYVVARRRLSTAYLDCDEAAAIRASDPRMAGARTVKSTRVTVRYVSPADRQVHTAGYSFGGGDAKIAALRVGGVVPIMANIARPTAIEER